MEIFSQANIVFLLILFSIAAIVALFIYLQFPKKKSVILRRDKLSQNSEQSRISDKVKLTSNELLVHKEAEKLAKNGDFLKAATLLENLGLPRQAIQLLEDFGAVEEACAILIKMNRPNRAAVVYERHHKFEKAAAQYLLANMPEDAGRCFFETGLEKPEYFVKAANLFESCEHYEEAFHAYEAAGNLPSMLKLCLKHHMWSSLQIVLNNPKHTIEAIELMSPMDIKRFVKALPLNEKTCEQLASWCQSSHRKELINSSLKCVILSPKYSAYFWKQLSEEFTKSTCLILIQAAHSQQKEWISFVLKHANSLFEAQKYQPAASLFAACNRYFMVFKCEVFLSQYSHALSILQKMPQEKQIVQKIIQKMKDAGIEDVSKIIKGSRQETVLREILGSLIDLDDAEADAREAASPFTLSA